MQPWREGWMFICSFVHSSFHLFGRMFIWKDSENSSHLFYKTLSPLGPLLKNEKLSSRSLLFVKFPSTLVTNLSSQLLLLFPVILVLAPRVFDILPFGHFGDQDDDVIEPEPVEDVEHPQTGDEDAEKGFESFVDNAGRLEHVDAFRRAAGDDAQGEEEEPRGEPQQGENGEQNGGESTAFRVGRHFRRLKNRIHDVVEQQNDTANP